MKFIKKPIPIDAVKVIKENEGEIIVLLDSSTTKYEPIISEGKIVGFNIHSWEGCAPVYYGTNYWVIKGLKGEAYPCVGDDEGDAPLGYTEAKNG